MTLPVAPAVPQIPAGYAPLAADMTAWVTTPFQFLTDGVLFRAQMQGGQALTGGSPTQVNLDTILEDPYGGWSATATGSQAPHSWLCPAGCSGWYEVSLTGMAASQTGATTQVGAQCWVDGALYEPASLGWGVSGHAGGASGAVQVPLLGGSDYVQMFILATTSVSTPTTAGQYPTMEITWLGS